MEVEEAEGILSQDPARMCHLNDTTKVCVV